MKDLAKLSAREGLFVCPGGVAKLTAARKLAESGWIKPDEKFVLLNTCAGIK